MLGLVGIAALLPALRAGRLSAVQAIATGRAPRTGRGYAAHRLLARLRLPRPVTIGLAAPFARPARTAVTLVAVLLGRGDDHLRGRPQHVARSRGGGLSHAQARAGAGLIPARRPGRGRNRVRPAGRRRPAAGRQRSGSRRRCTPSRARCTTWRRLTTRSPWPGCRSVPVTAFRGDARWTGYDMVSGRWYTGPGQVVVSPASSPDRRSVGDTVTIVLRQQAGPGADRRGGLRGRRVQMITDWPTLAAVQPNLTPGQYDVGLRPGTDGSAYVQGLAARLGPAYRWRPIQRNSQP